tara:strand:+ start:1279 stop:1725 length:447 start_codon:yes stop_codon:yes gene_type:complete
MHIYHESRYRARKKYYEKEINKEKKRIYMRNRYQRMKNKYQPLPEGLVIKSSMIHGLGLFAERDFSIGENFGMCHFAFGEEKEKKIIRTPLGGFINHSNNPNCAKVSNQYTMWINGQGNFTFLRYNLIALRNIKENEEITLKYSLYEI